MKNPLKKISGLGKGTNIEERGTKVCSSCGKSFPLELNFCQDCGIQLTEAVIKVPKVVSSKPSEVKPETQRLSNSPQRPTVQQSTVQQSRPNLVRPTLRAPVREPSKAEGISAPPTRRSDPEVIMIKDSVEKMHKMVRDHSEMLEEIRREQLRLSTDMATLMDFLRIFNESARNVLSRSIYESKDRG